MLYVFHGPDIATSVEKANNLAASLRAKKPDAAYVRIEANDWNASMIEGHLGGQGLFSNKYIVFLDRVTENTEAKEQLADFAPALNESSNIFIVLEGKINADLKKTFDKHAEKVIVSEEKAAAPSKKKEVNVFALSDAVGARDRFKAWSVYRETVDAGTEPENILGTLFWQIKSMIIASKAASASDSGLSPFVYSKSKRAAGNYSPQELAALAEKIITLYHDGHRGVADLELGVEMMCLSL